MRRLLLLFFISISFSFCNNNEKPKGIIPKERMVSFLTDFHLANGYASSISGDSANKKIAGVYKAVYQKYGTDSVRVRKSLRFYVERPVELERIYKDVDSNISKIQQAEQKRLDWINKKAEAKAKLKEEIKKNKEQYTRDKLKMKKGKYDFGLPSYTPPEAAYLQLWKNPRIPAPAADSTSIDSLSKE